MQAATNPQYTAEHGKYRLRSEAFTEVEHDVAIRRVCGMSHKAVGNELGFSSGNSNKTAMRVMDKVIPPAGWSDENPQPRNIQDLIGALLSRGDLTLLSVGEITWLLYEMKAGGFLDAVQSIASLFSLTDEH